jgi:hypothetical protein
VQKSSALTLLILASRRFWRAARPPQPLEAAFFLAGLMTCERVSGQLARWPRPLEADPIYGLYRGFSVNGQLTYQCIAFQNQRPIQEKYNKRGEKIVTTLV